MKFIKTDKAPAAVGPYNQGVLSGNILFVSGQLPINMETGELENDVKKAAKASLSNILEVVKAAGGSLESIIKLNVFVADINDFSDINEVYADFFGDHKPARSLVEVSNIPKGGILEIEAEAFID
ncbi:MAG: Rid family detoxifying hydrolase [Peptoniphilaceae bacterium]|nr:Rid family detoxifying hydrolase [Peptoniphilaceae bacterium]MDD7383730.1 Rid family detoxifying hydrolase [Peptoniphilaceae bacterium]MDY3737871.1 Rid family detoxifying hydrolase [Peptoniphilaceae bacterium]